MLSAVTIWPAFERKCIAYFTLIKFVRKFCKAIIVTVVVQLFSQYGRVLKIVTFTKNGKNF